VRRLLFGAAVLALAACSSGPALPGSATVGTYTFTATRLSGDCAFTEQPDGGFTFDGTITYDPGTDHGYFTVNEKSRDAGFDGQHLDAPASAQRIFSACDCGSDVTVKEDVRLVLLSQSQRDALNGKCPADALDGGVPAPNDAGILSPGPRGDRYDATLACGEQTDEIIPGSGCSCSGCTLRYSLSGVLQ
jgi:hypothetical protein